VELEMGRKRNKTKVGLIFVVLLLALCTLTASYSMWHQDLQIQGTVTTLEDFNYLCMEGYWPLDETSGTNAPDSSMNENDGTVYGATWTTGSGINGCLSFDGVDDYVGIPDDDTLDITVDGVSKALDNVCSNLKDSLLLLMCNF